jgi:hypothetical protein
MESNSLNPGRLIDSETMKAFLSSSDFKTQLTRFTNKRSSETNFQLIEELRKAAQ